MEDLKKADCATQETAVEQVLTALSDIICNYTDLRKANNECSMGMYNAIIESVQLATAYGESTVSMLKRIVNEWEHTYSENINIRNNAFHELSKKFVECHKHILKDKELHYSDGHLFNVFNLLSRYLGIGETLHSRLLYFLLSDDALHGQKNKFLLEFLKCAGIDNPEDGEWEITAETGHVDIMLKRNYPQHSVVIVENKSNGAVDQANQLYRYWYKNIHRYIEDFDERYYEKNNQYRIIYLAPNENKTYSEQTCCKPPRNHDFFNTDEDFNSAPYRVPLQPVVWTFNRQLQEWLEQCMEILDVNNHPVREYIRQYKEYCQTL